MRVVLNVISDTQRIVADITPDNTRLYKEWRKTKDSEWNISKGITVLNKDIENLSKVLKNEDVEQLEAMYKML